MFSVPRISLLRSRALVIVPVLAALVIAGPASAGQPVVGQLNPEPPDIYSCKATGDGTICRASTVESYADEPTGIICGSDIDSFEVLDTAIRHLDATRWYDREGNLTRRERTSRLVEAHLSNPVTGASVSYAQHNTDIDQLAIPGDFNTDTWTGHGVLAITVPGSGAVVLEAGRTIVGPGGNVEAQSGPSDLSDYFNGDASVVADMCAALMAI